MELGLCVGERPLFWHVFIPVQLIYVRNHVYNFLLKVKRWKVKKNIKNKTKTFAIKKIYIYPNENPINWYDKARIFCCRWKGGENGRSRNRAGQKCINIIRYVPFQSEVKYQRGWWSLSSIYGEQYKYEQPFIIWVLGYFCAIIAISIVFLCLYFYSCFISWSLG